MNGKEWLQTLAADPMSSRLSPAMMKFLSDYLAREKVVDFDGCKVINTHFPPYPSGAFERLIEQLTQDGSQGSLYSVTWAVTNRCCFACRHCYNAGRCQDDVPPATMQNLAVQLRQRGATMVTLTGGEPLLRPDLEDICRALGEDVTTIIGTTGWGLTPARARALRESGAFGMGISLDSDDEREHDTNRGRPGAFRAAVDAVETAGCAGLYPYVVTMANRDLLQPERFYGLLEFAGYIGAREVHLLEPSLTGNLAGRTDLAFGRAERRQIMAYQRDVAAREDLPVLSTFTYLESECTFGCGAGLQHIYIDGSGELCPCNLIPMSFGNIAADGFEPALTRMGRHFQCTRAGCAAKLLARHVRTADLPTPPDVSDQLCAEHLPAKHAVPAFVKARLQLCEHVGSEDLRQTYDQVNGDYDRFWVSKAGRPVTELIERLQLAGDESVFEAGCGTGFGTRQLASGINGSGRVDAVDLSAGMLAQARRRVNGTAADRVHFRHGDALQLLADTRDLDLVISTWVLGYIPLRPFFMTAAEALRPGGRVAFVVHRDNSPREPMELYRRLIALDPSVMVKQVDFDFPTDAAAAKEVLRASGFRREVLWEGKVVFRYDTPQEVLDHLLKSGAGTVFYEAVDPARREELTARFLNALADQDRDHYDVVHDYVAGIAERRR